MVYGDRETSSIKLIDYSVHCGKPGFAQFEWSRGAWRHLANIQPDLKGGSRNLMEYSSTTGVIQKDLTLNAKRALNLDSPRKRQAVKVLSPEVVAKNCSEGVE